MAKRIIYKPRTSNAGIRKAIKFYYVEKFFNKWMNKYDFPQLSYQQKHYIMKKFWSVGTVAVSDVRSSAPEMDTLISNDLVDMGSDAIIFTPWAPANFFNIYDFPTHIRLINTRGVKFITERELQLDKEAVILYAQKNHKSVFSSIEAKLEELIDIEMKKRVARKSQSQPWLFVFSPEDYDNVKNLQEQIEDDNPYLFIPVQDANTAKSLNSGAPYIVDKLEQDRQKVENDILTMLGCNNVGIGEKKEHLIVDEVNANNQDIEEQNMSFESELEEGFERVEKVLGFRVDVIDNNEIIMAEESEEQDDPENKEDNIDA